MNISKKIVWQGYSAVKKDYRRLFNLQHVLTSKKDMKKAPNSVPAVMGLTISPLEISALKKYNFTGRIIVVDTLEKDAQVKSIFENEKYLGFDTESRPSVTTTIMNPISIVQLSSKDVSIIWKIQEMNFVPPVLTQILTSQDTIKVVHGASREILCLENQYKVMIRSLIDLHHLALGLKCQPKSLQSLVALFCGKHLSKEHQLSDWSKTPLTEEQIQYAANDSHASLEVLFAMRKFFNTSKLSCEQVIDPVTGFFGRSSPNDKGKKANEAINTKDNSRHEMHLSESDEISDRIRMNLGKWR